MEDTQIVQFYWDRDERAIPATADKYGNYCTAIAKNILGIPEDAEECVNDTYMRAWNSMPPHRPNVLSAFLGENYKKRILKPIQTEYCRQTRRWGSSGCSGGNRRVGIGYGQCGTGS